MNGLKSRARTRSEVGRRKSTTRLLTVLMVAAVVILAGCAGSEEGSKSGMKPVTIGTYPGNYMSVPAFVAHEKGFLKKNGLNAKVIIIDGGGPGMMSALVSGGIDFGQSAFDNLLLARQTGIRVKTIVGNVPVVPYQLVVRKGVATPHRGQPYPAPVKDLKGLKIGVTALGASGQFILQMMLSDAGLTDRDVTFVAVPLPTAVVSLKAKQIDAYMGFEPVPTGATSSGVGKIIVDMRNGGGPKDFGGVAYNGWWATDKYLKAGHDTEVDSFRKAMIDTDIFMHNPANLDEVVKIAKKVLPMGSMNENEFREFVKSSLSSLGTAVPAKTIPSWNKILINRKLLKKAIPESDAIVPEAIRDVGSNAADK